MAIFLVWAKFSLPAPASSAGEKTKPANCRANIGCGGCASSGSARRLYGAKSYAQPHARPQVRLKRAAKSKRSPLRHNIFGSLCHRKLRTAEILGSTQPEATKAVEHRGSTQPKVTKAVEQRGSTWRKVTKAVEQRGSIWRKVMPANAGPTGGLMLVLHVHQPVAHGPLLGADVHANAVGIGLRKRCSEVENHGAVEHEQQHQH